MKRVTSLGVVSPCSTCANQRSVSDSNGNMNICPRRSWQSQYVTEIAGDTNAQARAASIKQLALTGTTTDPSLTTPLQNPVLDTDGATVLVWTALFAPNRAKLDVNGNLINPNLSDGQSGYDTNYIICEQYPYTPNVDEHGYYLNGALKEWEPIQVTQGVDQYEPDGVTLKHIAGTVNRASFGGTIVRNPVLFDNAPSGT